MFSGSPFWGRSASGAVFRESLLGVPTAITLKRIGLTERFLILQVHRPFVKSFEKFFYCRYGLFCRLFRPKGDYTTSVEMHHNNRWLAKINCYSMGLAIPLGKAYEGNMLTDGGITLHRARRG